MSSVNVRVVAATETPSPEADRPLGPGTGPALMGVAEIRNHFDGRWVAGFEVVAAVRSQTGWTYRIRRCSDGVVLPTTFDPDEIKRCLDGR